MINLFRQKKSCQSFHIKLNNVTFTHTHIPTVESRFPCTTLRAGTPSLTPYNQAKHGTFLYPLCLRRRLSINSCGAWVREGRPLSPLSLWSGLPFSHRQLLIDFTHRGRRAVWGRSLGFRNKSHCSSCSHAFLPLIFLLQPLAFCYCCSFSYYARVFPAFLSPR